MMPAPRHHADADGFTRAILAEKAKWRARPIVDDLTTRERQVLTLIAYGQTTKEIAAALGMAFRTAACHRHAILSKLHARNTADLVRYAIRAGLAELW